MGETKSEILPRPIESFDELKGVKEKMVPEKSQTPQTYYVGQGRG